MQCIYCYVAFEVKVRGCKNMWLAECKIQKWKKKYMKKNKCEYCHNTPCCLEDMASLITEEGERLESRSDLQNASVRYHLYRSSARNYFGFLGWKNRKQLPDCIVALIRKLYPKGDDEDYTDFIACDKFHIGEYGY